MRPLRDYQKEMLRYCIKKQHPALFVQMRLGKTIVAIRSVKVRGDRKILVVAPYSALYGWRLELIAENQEVHGITELYGTGNERLHLLKKEYANSKWLLFNKEGHLILPEIKNFYFDTIIIDESTFIKSPSSLVSDFFIKNFRDAKHRYVLSGHPAPESELDYYCQIKFLDYTMLKERTYWDFRHKNFAIIHFTPYMSPKGYKYLTNILAENCFFLTRQEVKLGGEKIYEKRKIKLTDKVNKIYRRVEKEFLLEYLGMEQETIYAMTKYIWLRRLCGGFADKEFISYAKIKELESILKSELKKEQVIILARFTNEVRKLSKYFNKDYKIGTIYGAVSKNKRPKIYEEFQKGNLDLLIAQPETIKHGVNLSASDTIIFYSSPDGGETRTQVEDRIVNTATNDSSLIIDLICEDTIEEDVIMNLQKKESKQKLIHRIVKRLQNKYGTVSK